MTRLSQAQIVRMTEDMSSTRRRVIETVAALRLVSGGQLRRCCFAEETSRWARRELAALTEQRVLQRLVRRVGGVRAGSDGFVYALGPVGARLIEYVQGRGLPRSRSSYEPGAPFVAHALALSEIYVGLLEAERMNPSVEVLEFVAEPGCWRSFTGRLGGAETLKPDAYLRVAAAREELSWFLEVDRATHRRGALERKHGVYLDYFRSGREQAEHGLFPAVLWSVPTPERQQELTRIAGQPGPDGTALFQAVTSEQTVSQLLDQHQNHNEKGTPS